MPKSAEEYTHYHYCVGDLSTNQLGRTITIIAINSLEKRSRTANNLTYGFYIRSKRKNKKTNRTFLCEEL